MMNVGGNRGRLERRAAFRSCNVVFTAGPFSAFGNHLIARTYTPSVYLEVTYPVLPSISAERNPASRSFAR